MSDGQTAGFLHGRLGESSVSAGRVIGATAALVVVLLTVAPRCPAAQYTIEPLGSLGGNYSRAESISNSGLVAGYAYTPASVEHAFLWQSGSMVDLGTLGGSASRAYDVNVSGQVGGWAATELGQARPVLWDRGAIYELPTLGGPAGSVRGINDWGHAVGNAYLTSSVYHAALWRGGAVVDLGTLGGAYSMAYDINRSGDVAGYAYDAAGAQWACLWADGTTYNLGRLAGATASAAKAVNDRRQVIVWNYGLGHSALWQNAQLIDLGTLGGPESWAYGLNNRGQAVGWAELQSGIYHAFFWTDADANGLSDPGEMLDLGTLGGLFSSAYAINDAGIIVGYAQNSSGQWQAVRWVPVPEPNSLVLLLSALPALAQLRRKPASSHIARSDMFKPRRCRP